MSDRSLVPATVRRREKRRHDPEFAARERETARRWREAHPDRRAASHRRWYLKNRERVIEDSKRYYSENRLLVRARTARRLYGVSVERFLELYAASNGLCAVCGQPETHVIRGLPQPLSFDHSHATGAARGFLCADCNTGLGLFTDDPARLRAAADYLEKSA